jgi:hypothetical protein
MKEIYVAVKRHSATLMGIIFIPVRPLAHVTLKIVHHVSVIQMVKQTVQHFRKRYIEICWLCSNGHEYCRLINMYRIHHELNAALDTDYPNDKD